MKGEDWVAIAIIAGLTLYWVVESICSAIRGDKGD